MDRNTTFVVRRFERAYMLLLSSVPCNLTKPFPFISSSPFLYPIMLSFFSPCSEGIVKANATSVDHSYETGGYDVAFPMSMHACIFHINHGRS